MSAFDSLVGGVGDRVIRPGRVELAAAMGAPPVVVGRVLGQDRPQVPLAEDEHAAGDLGTGGGYEPFRITVAPRRQLRPIQMTGTDGCG